MPLVRSSRWASHQRLAEDNRRVDRQTENPRSYRLGAWTRHPLTAGTNAGSRRSHAWLHQWTAAEVEEHLSGDAAILKAPTSGELVSPRTSLPTSTKSIAPIRRRWQPSTPDHRRRTTSASNALGKPNRGRVPEIADQLEVDAVAVEGTRWSGRPPLVSPRYPIRQEAATAHERVHSLARGDLDLLQQQLANLPGPPHGAIKAPTAVRSRQRSSVTNARRCPPRRLRRRAKALADGSWRSGRCRLQ